jgi:hypothetical protein
MTDPKHMCAHDDKCTRWTCITPVFGRRPGMGIANKPDVWQVQLVQQYAQHSMEGAGESSTITLEV